VSTNGKRRWKWIVVVVVLALIGAGFGWWWHRHNQDNTQYQTATVSRREMTQTVTATGTLNPVTNVTVGCQISGTIARLPVDFNSSVTNGQVVAEIEPFIYDANVQLATADVANARAALELARINAKRAQELLAGKLIPQADFDTAIASLHQAEAVLQNRQATLARAPVDLLHCTIRSPVNGTVISRNVDVGQTVAASLSAPTLFTIANDLSKMQIDSNVAEADVGSVAVGQDVDFTVDAFSFRTFHGKVVQVRNAPISVQNVVTYDTVIAVDNSDLKLKPGMTANVSIIIARHDEVLSLPNAALRFRPAEAITNATAPAASNVAAKRDKAERRFARTVYTLQNNKPTSAKIKIGISDGIFTEVIEGLSESNQVITSAIYKQNAQVNNPLAGGMRPPGR